MPLAVPLVAAIASCSSFEADTTTSEGSDASADAGGADAPTAPAPNPFCPRGVFCEDFEAADDGWKRWTSSDAPGQELLRVPAPDRPGWSLLAGVTTQAAPAQALLYQSFPRALKALDYAFDLRVERLESTPPGTFVDVAVASLRFKGGETVALHVEDVQGQDVLALKIVDEAGTPTAVTTDPPMRLGTWRTLRVHHGAVSSGTDEMIVTYEGTSTKARALYVANGDPRLLLGARTERTNSAARVHIDNVVVDKAE